jgi:hypothetical protein
MELKCGQEEKRSGVECGQAEVEGRGGELVLLKLQGAYSGQVDRRASRATGLGNRPAQGHTQFSALHTLTLHTTISPTLNPLQGTKTVQLV